MTIRDEKERVMDPGELAIAEKIPPVDCPLCGEILHIATCVHDDGSCDIVMTCHCDQWQMIEQEYALYQIEEKG